MAVCWRFVMVLLLTLASLVAPSQPLFQPPAGPYQMLRGDLRTSSAMIENQIPLDGPAGSDVEQSWNVPVGRRGRFRRLVQRGGQVDCDLQLKCQRRKGRETHNTLDDDRERSRIHETLAKYRLPPTRHMAHLNSDRMVPTGPNPLHNSNRSQIAFP